MNLLSWIIKERVQRNNYFANLNYVLWEKIKYMVMFCACIGSLPWDCFFHTITSHSDKVSALESVSSVVI